MNWRKGRGRSSSADPARDHRPADADRSEVANPVDPSPPLVEPAAIPPIGEPTPAGGEDVPVVVLDELRQAFTGTPPTGPVRPDEPIVDPTVDPTFDGTLDLTIDGIDFLDDLPPAEPDVLDSLDDLVEPARTGDTARSSRLTLPADLPAADLDDDALFGARSARASQPAAPPAQSPAQSSAQSPTASGRVMSGPLASVPEPWQTDPTGRADRDDHTEAWVIDTPDVRIVPRDRTGGDAPAPAGAPDPGPAGSRPTAPPPGPATAGTARATIVIGGDDSLPDAIYLDDDAVATNVRGPAELEPNARGMIVIGDELEASGAFDAVAVPSRSMDPRVRARRIAVKRAQGRKRLLWVAGVGGVVVVIVAVLGVFSSGLFAVEQVDVQGAPYTQARYGDRMQSVIDEMMGEPVLLVDTEAAVDALEQLPWIERAFVTTDFPDRVLIDVRERQPLATFEGSDGRFRVVDRDGYVLDVLDGRPSNYMLVGGIGPDLEAGSPAGAQYSAAAQLVGALPAEIRDITVEATLDPTTGDLGLVIQRIDPPDPDGSTETTEATAVTEPPLVEVRIGSFNGLDGKLARLLQLVRSGLDDTGRVDVSTDDVIG